jgi:hypothetical protein
MYGWLTLYNCTEYHILRSTMYHFQKQYQGIQLHGRPPIRHGFLVSSVVWIMQAPYWSTTLGLVGSIILEYALVVSVTSESPSVSRTSRFSIRISKIIVGLCGDGRMNFWEDPALTVESWMLQDMWWERCGAPLGRWTAWAWVMCELIYFYSYLCMVNVYENV